MMALILVSVTTSLWGPVLAVQAGPGDTQELVNDAFIAPDLPTGKLNRDASPSVTPGYYQTSAYMVGSVAVGIVLVACDGSLDPLYRELDN